MKKIWLILQSALLALTIISGVTGAQDVFNVCWMILIASSFPLNIVVAWVFTTNLVWSFPVFVIMAFVLCALTYLQWFELIPRLGRLLSAKFPDRERHITINVERIDHAQLAAALPPDASEWLNTSNDNEKYSPVERLLSQD
ncbi:MAG: hypothetical protein ABIO91_03235 [Pyrinomonadaceae bacterium]